MKTITLYRNGVEVATIHQDSNSVQSKQVMGDNILSLAFVLPQFVAFKVGDYTTVFDELYKVNQQPVINKLSGRWEYTLTMHAEYYDLTKVQYLFLGETNTLTQTDFALTGTLDVFLSLLLRNANRVSPTWKKGDIISTGTKTLTFSRENCLQVLQRLATEFATEWWVEGKTVHLSQRRTVSNLRFRHGRNKGLYSITRQALSDTKIVTRLYAVGANKNLPPNYRNGQQYLKMIGGTDYLEANTDQYGVIEDAAVFEDIYPTRTGKVTAIGDIYTFFDSTLNFDINQYFIGGVEPKITFNTGQLAGYTFKIQSYNPTTKGFKILRNTEEKSLEVPSELLHAALNDEYVLTDIYLPQAYVDDAERRVSVAAETLLSKIARDQYAYAVDISPTYMQGRGYHITIGTQVGIQDEELALDDRITVVRMTRNLQNEWKYTVELSDKKQPGTIQQLQTSIATTDRAVQSVGRAVDSLPIQNNNVVGDLKIKDGTVIIENIQMGEGDPSTFQQVFIHRFTRKLYTYNG